jgi:hypothetical protein
MDWETNVKRLVASATLATCFVMGSCTPPVGSVECREHLLSNLKSPSSFKIIKESSYIQSLTPEEAKVKFILPGNLLAISKAKTLTFRHVTIDYDADNSYGAALRDTEYCTFVDTPLGPRKVEYNLDENPKLTADNVMTIEEEADAALRAADEALDDSKKADREFKALLEQ